MGQLPHVPPPPDLRTVGAMNKYIIERNFPGAGGLSAEDLQKIARKSVEVLDSMDRAIQWNESFIAGDRLFCVYLAESEDAIREHGRRGGFPVDGAYEVTGSFDPTTATTKVAT
jgi:Protein of unknown function (DUF4242)